MNTLYTIRSFKIILYQNVPPFFSTFVINIVTYNTYSWTFSIYVYDMCHWTLKICKILGIEKGHCIFYQYIVFVLGFSSLTCDYILLFCNGHKILFHVLYFTYHVCVYFGSVALYYYTINYLTRYSSDLGHVFYAG